MKMMKFFDPVMFGVESFYSVIILLLCLMVFFKTKEMYDLTKHKGIQFFRYAFLFFGLSYASRLFLHFMVLGQNIVRHGRTIMPLSNLLVAFFSTLAIVYLLYSTIWKKVKGEQYITLANVLALIIAVVAFVSRSPAIIFFIQLCLLIIATVISAISHKRLKKKTNTKALYLLILFFWLLNLFAIGFRLPLNIKIVFNIISIGIFVTIYYKVHKWVK